MTKNPPVYGLDVVYWDAWKDSIQLTVGWDIWRGAFVFPHSFEGDGYVVKLAAHFDAP